MEEQIIVPSNDDVRQRRTVWVAAGSAIVLLVSVFLFFGRPLLSFLPSKEGVIPFHPAGEIRTIAGTVVAVGDGSFTLRPANDPFGGSLAERTVFVTASTTVFRLARKDPAIFQKEMKDFTREIASSSSTPLVAPTMFSKGSAAFSDITAGSEVIVTASNDVTRAEEFAADEILIKSPRGATSTSL